MTLPELKNIPQFIGTLPATLNISDGEERLIVANQVTSGTINIGRDCNITIVTLLTEGWEETKKIHFNFDGENSTLTFIALIIGTDENKFPLETISNHNTKHTNAYYYIRSAMFDRSQINYKGNLIIKKGAQVTDSYLAHHTLMLSKNAKTHSIPCLEIEADDVKAGHAATIGKVDEHLLFYLQSRGLSKDEAQDILIKGFMESELQKIDSEEIRLILSEEIEKYLNTHAELQKNR